ncbi:hypothetical protein I7I51_06629 [Histoplasma capsulatum]|uniref:Uncharacterized protein n=1 Tax=Ajellomyces capsulatus TaxID=5037 RepID=A0A8A1MKX1_AJECA|nr:hypothetical protein I7I51_06629 [Histoplasma capsulatum]
MKGRERGPREMRTASYGHATQDGAERERGISYYEARPEITPLLRQLQQNNAQGEKKKTSRLMAVVFSTGHVGFSQMPASDWGTASWCTLRGRPSPLLPHASTPSHRPSLAPREQGGPLAAVTANNSQQQPTKAGNKQNSLIYDYLLCFPVFPHTAQESLIRAY